MAIKKGACDFFEAPCNFFELQQCPNFEGACIFVQIQQQQSWNLMIA
jgi:hypothetical protein